MQHTVFVNDKPLRFANVYEVEQWKGNTESLFAGEQDLSVEEAIHELEQTRNHPGFIYMTAHADAAWKLFLTYCTLSEASGGLVTNDKEEYLLIFRRGVWDLPKGKVEYDETPKQAALREVQEECGLKELEIIHTLTNTFHTYFLHGKRILKKTHWYLMKTEEKKLTPQKEEDIEEAKWMSREEIRRTVYPLTYSSIKELLQKALAQ